MRRFWIVLIALLIVWAGALTPRVVNVSASTHTDAASAKKHCKKGYKLSHGKCKKRHRVIAPTPTPTPIPTLETGIKIDIGGYKLFIRCIGTGSPTVVLDATYGADSTDWNQVQTGVAAFTRVCTYDRAGDGQSDRRLHSPGTLEQMVVELHTLLSNAHVDGPYVMVGNGLGGLVARLYAYQRPTEVVGVGLIDALHEGWCTARPHYCGGAAEDVDIVTYAQVPAAAHGPLKGSFGTLPLVVVSNGVGYGPGKSAADNLVWDGLQTDLASASTNSVHVIAKRSDHAIASEQPELVVEAIHELVTAARSTSHTLPPCGQALEQLGGKCVSR